MNYLYNLAYSAFNYILDYTLYYKIYIQESQYFKLTYNYFYPTKNIIHAKLCNDDKIIDITDRFTHMINNGKINWKDLLIEETENMHSCDKCHLDIRYMIKDNCFRIIYKYDNNDIQFPPYDQETIDKCNNSNEYKKTILFAELNGEEGVEDVTQLLKEYSGPLNNFYEDSENVDIHACLIKNDSGEYVLIEDKSLSITDSHANDLEFKKEDILKLK